MTDPTTASSVLFKALLDRPAARALRRGVRYCSKAADERLGLTARLGACPSNSRDPSRIHHFMIDLLRQRVFGIAIGYEDCNDAARPIDDPILRLLLDRDPIDGAPIASQPTLSRFENRIDVRSIVRMGRALADTVVARQRERRAGQARRITIDLDPTDDPTHGTQQLSSFNACYDTWCYLPVAGSATFDDDPEPHPVAWMLRPGTACVCL